MQNYLDIANSSLIYIMGIIVVLFVFIQCVIFLLKAWKEGKRIGLSRDKMMSAVKASATFSIVPSIPIVISLIAMAPVLGIPFPWIRLSIIGSAPYELMSAEIGAQSMGVEGLGGNGYTAQVFANSMWVMSIGIIWGLLMCVVFLKRIQRGVQNINKKDNAWGEILIMSLFFGLISAFVGPSVVKGGIELLTLLSGAAIMLILTFLIKKLKIDWLNNFALSLSMIGAMALAILYTNLF